MGGEGKEEAGTDEPTAPGRREEEGAGDSRYGTEEAKRGTRLLLSPGETRGRAVETATTEAGSFGAKEEPEGQVGGQKERRLC